MSEGAVVFGQVFAEQHVDLRWPTLADREFVIVIAVMLLIAKETPRDQVVPQIEILQDFAQSFPWFPLCAADCPVGQMFR